MNSLKRLQLKSEMGRVAVFSVILLFFCFVAGCSDKGDSPPEEPAGEPRCSYIVPDALSGFDTIIEVAVIDEKDWGSTESLPEGSVWEWNDTEHRIALWNDTDDRVASRDNLDFPVSSVSGKHSKIVQYV